MEALKGKNDKSCPTVRLAVCSSGSGLHYEAGRRRSGVDDGGDDGATCFGHCSKACRRRMTATSVNGSRYKVTTTQVAPLAGFRPTAGWVRDGQRGVS